MIGLRMEPDNDRDKDNDVHRSTRRALQKHGWEGWELPRQAQAPTLGLPPGPAGHCPPVRPPLGLSRERRCGGNCSLSARSRLRGGASSRVRHKRRSLGLNTTTGRRTNSPCVRHKVFAGESLPRRLRGRSLASFWSVPEGSWRRGPPKLGGVEGASVGAYLWVRPHAALCSSVVAFFALGSGLALSNWQAHWPSGRTHGRSRPGFRSVCCSTCRTHSRPHASAGAASRALPSRSPPACQGGPDG